MCGFDGRLGRNPVAIEAAHVRWHSQDGPDDLANAVALCSLHHALFDCGVLGLSPDLQITVSPLYVATSQAGRAIDVLAGQPLLHVRPGQPSVDVIYVNWHRVQVFKSHGHQAEYKRSPTSGTRAHGSRLLFGSCHCLDNDGIEAVPPR